MTSPRRASPEPMRAVGAESAVDDGRGNPLSGEKPKAIVTGSGHRGATAMNGDSINGTRTQADIGIATGAAGTDTAMEGIAVAVMNGDLRLVAPTIRLSRRTHAVLWRRLAPAPGINTVFFVLAPAGNATMWMAVFTDMGASLPVDGNGLRRRRRRTRRARP